MTKDEFVIELKFLGANGAIIELAKKYSTEQEENIKSLQKDIKILSDEKSRLHNQIVNHVCKSDDQEFIFGPGG